MEEKEHLQQLAGQPFGTRILGYLKLTGPGYMQSAMTLGGGSIAACMTFGSLLGYELLWVQPLAMILGCLVLAAIAKQVCHTGEKPYTSFWDRLHPGLAVLWGAAALVSTVIWHFPQYTLTANGFLSVLEGAGLGVDSGSGERTFGLDILLGGVLLGCAIFVTNLYHSGARGVKWFENTTKILVWAIVAIFALVAITTGIQWNRFFLGITGISFIRDLTDANGLDPTAVKPIVGGMAAALGINMVFLYPYSLLNKKWGKDHKELAYFDLVSGMMIPFFLATGFMVLAVANTIGPAEGVTGEITKNIKDIVPVVGPTLGGLFGGEETGARIALGIIGLGMMAVGFTSIIMHMLACGFIGCEMFGYAHDSRARFWFSLIPAVGVYGVTMKAFPWQAAITASSLNAPLLPITVLCFLVLLNNKKFMGDARPEGAKRVLWNLGLGTAVVVMSIAAYFGLTTNFATLMKNLNPPEEAAAGTIVQDEWADLETLVDPDRVQAVVRHQAMGTDFEFTLVGSRERMDEPQLVHAAGRAFEAISALEANISRWQPDSDTSRVNREAAAGPISIGGDLLDTLRVSRTVYERTDGAFDVTVGPLIAFWREHDPGVAKPTADVLTPILERVGLSKVAVDETAGTVRFDQEGVALDFGGIGKGLALDRAATYLKDQGIVAGMIHGGTSTVIAWGAPPEGKEGWKVTIRNPLVEDAAPVAAVPLRDAALSTSGVRILDAELGGGYASHIYDPRTGLPAEDVLSATAIAPTGAESDALSTAFFVMGRDKTEDYCRTHPDVRAIMVLAQNGPEDPVWINFPASSPV